MEASKLLTEIYVSDEIKQVTKKLKPAHLQDDILQHVFCELYSKPELFIVDLHQRGKLKSFIVKMLYNTCYFNRTKFKKELGSETPTECFNEHFEEVETDLIPDMMKIIDTLYWYKKEILLLYVKHGTYQGVSDETGIPVTSIFNTIKDVRRIVKKEIWK